MELRVLGQQQHLLRARQHLERIRTCRCRATGGCSSPAYYGRPWRHKLARARLWGLMSNYGWTLWASIQDVSRAIEFDFWSWGLEKYERAEATFAGPDLERILADVGTAD